MVIYTVEILLKIIGYGFTKRDKGIFWDNWNFFDLIIVTVTWLNYFLSNL